MGTRLTVWAGTIWVALALAGDVHAQGQKGVAGKDAGATGAASDPADGELAPDMIGAFFPQRADVEAMKKRGFFATGLQPVYPPGATCFEADSLFAATTRGNGSRRSPRFYAGHHGGLDIPAPEGTPIIAVADGTVVHKSEGESIGGIGVVLQHTPEETGLPIWTYTEYKHLREIPGLKIGQKVKMGEVIARAGKTGTVGTPAYGSAGHSHLHLTAWYGASDKYRSGRMLIPLDGHWMDPLALFRGPPAASGEIEKLPDYAKKVPLPYKGTDGRVVPEGARVVWPFVCEKK